MEEQEYAVYREEEILVIGTAEECAKKMGVKPETIHYYSTPTAKRRLAKRKNQDRCIVVIKLDLDGLEE